MSTAEVIVFTSVAVSPVFIIIAGMLCGWFRSESDA